MKNKLYKKIMIAIFILALIVRLIYIIKTPYFDKQHDIEPDGNGLSYIFTIYNKGKLPDNNRGQKYHPPLHQILSALWLNIANIFTDDVKQLCESLQFLTVLYSMVFLFVILKILKYMHIKDKYKIIILFFLAFNPTMIILSGSINNDNLCFTLMAVVLLYLIKWYKDPKIRNIVYLGIVTGLCVMTKLSGAIMAVPILYIFLLRLYKEIKKSDNKSLTYCTYISAFVLFGSISCSIGLWYALRNNILFGQPILYVMDIHNADLYVGNYSFGQRFIPFSNEISQMYCNPSEDYNIPIYLLKCSLYGEFEWGQNNLFSICYWISIVTNIIFIIITLISIIKETFSKQKRNKEIKVMMFLLMGFNIISFISMNIKLPYGCSMDFRYMLPLLFISIIFIIFLLDSIERKNKRLECIIYKSCFGLIFLLILSTNIILFGS